MIIPFPIFIFGRETRRGVSEGEAKLIEAQAYLEIAKKRENHIKTHDKMSEEELIKHLKCECPYMTAFDWSGD